MSIGESIPPGPLGLVKCTNELSFTHKIYHEASKQTISIPPKRVTQSTWSQDVPQGLKNEVEIVRGNIYGGWIEGLKPEHYRMCWFVVPFQWPHLLKIILNIDQGCRHAEPGLHRQPTSPLQEPLYCTSILHLYIAGGGSFRSWKFIADIGKYVVQMLRGELASILAEK
jgi:sarcosine oxidase/L-pipecolate oxidase